MSAVIESIVESHAEDAAFLFVQRRQAVDAPHQTRRDLDRLDQRLEGHVDGLRVAGDAGRAIAEAEFERWGDAGEGFVVSVLALESREDGRIADAIAAASGPELTPALVSALGWVDPRLVEGLVGELARDGDPGRRALAVAAHSVHRTDPGPLLEGFLADTHEVRARAIRLAGELGRADLIASLGREDDPSCRFWAAWARARVGGGIATGEALADFVGGDALGRKALDLALRAMNPPEAAAFLLQLRWREGTDRTIALGAGMLGDPALVPWLLTRLRDPELARVAAASFASITGVDLAHAGLAAKEPSDFDDEVLTDDERLYDRDLPWPDRDKIWAWWKASKDAFEPGKRHLLGRPLDGALVTEVLASGSQRQRRAAALELAVAAPRTVLVNCAERTWEW